MPLTRVWVVDLSFELLIRPSFIDFTTPFRSQSSKTRCTDNMASSALYGS